MKFSKGHIPLYFQIYLQFKQDIIMGEYPPGSPLPGLYELNASTGVSHGMIRKALELLENEGLIVRKQRLGTFVNKNVDQLMWVPTSSIDQVIERLGNERAFPISEKWVHPPNRIKALFKHEKDAFKEGRIFKSHFLLIEKSDEKRRVLTDLFLPLWRYNQVSPKKLKKTPLKTTMNDLTLVGFKQIIRPWFCSHEASQYLDLPEGTPIFHRTLIAFRSKSKPLGVLEQLTTVYALERYIEINK